MQYLISLPGVQSNEQCECLDKITINGLGLVHPEKVFSFYYELHSYLTSTGVDGVKVDVQNILEALGAGYGGRVELARKYHMALTTSIVRNFKDNGTKGFYS
jgi:raffinose synthase